MLHRAQLVDAIREAASFLGGTPSAYDPLVAAARGRRFVLLGEATHGSQELYRERARITQRLIAEEGFNAVVVEADWPDAHLAHEWVLGEEPDDDAVEALRGFARFPAWMWRNPVMVEFLRWLRAHNERASTPAALYGMDLYALGASVEAVVRYLGHVDPPAARRARERYACFDLRSDDAFRSGGETYGRAHRFGLTPSCEEAALQQLLELSERARCTLDPELFSAEQNARLARNAEQYYRAMFGSRLSTWNLRDRHMADTLDAVAAFLERRDGYARIAVWAHNSHLGDARATQAADEGELNVGQLLRERHGDNALLVGFTTYDGWVTAARDWGAPAERMRVRPALHESVEAVFHEVMLPRFYLPLREPGEALAALREPLLERAIGVVYRPNSERSSHYFEARVAEQFDAVVHIDRASAVEPLEPAPSWKDAEPPETWPSAL